VANPEASIRVERALRAKRAEDIVVERVVRVSFSIRVEDCKILKLVFRRGFRHLLDFISGAVEEVSIETVIACIGLQAMVVH